MRDLNALAGFEKSGHFFFNAPVGRGYDDGFVTAIAVLDMLDRNPGKSMADLYRDLPKTWGSPTMSPHCADEVKYAVADRVVARFKAMQAKGEPLTGQTIRDVVTVNGVRVTVEDGTWGLVRASSNKPELVVVVESPVVGGAHARDVQGGRRASCARTPRSAPTTRRSETPAPRRQRRIRCPTCSRPGLRIVFCGTAAGTSRRARGAYYAHPQNKFWRALHAAGLTPRLLAPAEFAALPQLRPRPHRHRQDVSGMDQRTAAGALGRDACAAMAEKIARARPRILAFTSLTAGRRYLGRDGGLRRADGDASARPRLWLLPSPSPTASWNWDEAGGGRWRRRRGAGEARPPVRPAGADRLLRQSAERIHARPRCERQCP